MDEQNLYNVIFQTLKKEDCELEELTNKGIFYSPELYIAFLLGKAIKQNEKIIFNKKSCWLRETDFNKIGPTDFAFKIDETIYAFELKLRSTIHSYKKDIEKLKRLDENYKKYFLALVDVFDASEENDFRILTLEKDHPELERVADFKSFKTKQDRYKKSVSCIIGLWKII
ncbi:hypothetical protein [Galbibacter mesophilus]|uniref:hypothetical protein n=1 Tax=Galbibacter mesophilus TaxID=379069 RepID=UPI00191F7B10|nr:hypothetical protein [Galbibacter mesophilus]MCM5661954.1 hypothetical protein [Galbibacter mesophilus]